MNSPSLLLALLLALPVLGAGAPPALEWKQDTQSLALYQEGKPVWVFHHSPQQGAKPFFHPLALPGGAPLTCQSPSDHSWHYGLWFSWKYLNGVNYWEQNSKGASDGATAWDPPRFETLPDHRARIQLDLRYHPRSHSVPVLSERRSIDLSAPAADGAYFMDWTLVFTAGETNVTLDRTPPARQNGQTIPGGYAGLSARFSTNLTSARLAANAPAGPLLNNRHGYAATASDFSGLIHEARDDEAALETTRPSITPLPA